MSLAVYRQASAWACASALAVFLGSAAMAACGDGGTVDGIAVPSASDSPTVAKICEQGKVRAAVAPFAPHGFQDTDGSFKGAGVEIAAPAVAKLLGVDLEVMPVGWDTVVAGLQAGRYELVTTGLTYTDERAQVIDFAIFGVGGTCYVVKADSALKTLDDLNKPEVTIGVYTGTSWETDLPKIFPNAKFDSAVEGAGGGYRTADVLAGRIDAAPIDNVTEIAVKTAYPNLRIVPEGDACLTNPNPIDRVGIGLPKDPAFKTFVEAVVAAHKDEMDAKMKEYMAPEYVKVGG
jgi:ABC-type amino acid transport substrate-binding protein